MSDILPASARLPSLRRMSAIRDQSRFISLRWGILPGYRWAQCRRWGDRYGVDPWLSRFFDPLFSLVIVLLRGAVLGSRVAVFVPGW